MNKEIIKLLTDYKSLLEESLVEAKNTYVSSVYERNLNYITPTLTSIEECLAKLQADPTEAEIERVAEGLYNEGFILQSYREVAISAIKAMR